MLFCKLQSQKALNTGQVLFSYCPIMLYDKLPQNSVACKNKHVFSCSWVCGSVGIQYVQADQAPSCVLGLDVFHVLPILLQLAGYLSCISIMVMRKHRKAEGSPNGQHTSAVAWVIPLASNQPKLITRPNRRVKGMGLDLCQFHFCFSLMWVSLGKGLTLLCSSVSCSVKWE